MGLVEELGTFVAAASTRFAVGTSLFLNMLPDEPHRASAITETGGSAPAYVFGNDLPSYENARVAITTRSTSSVTARADAHAAWVAVQKISNEDLSSVGWLRCSAVQSPFLLRRDEQGRVLFQANYDCTRRTTST